MLSRYQFANCYLIRKLLFIFNHVKFVTMLVICSKINVFVDVIHSFVLIHLKKNIYHYFFVVIRLLLIHFKHFKINFHHFVKFLKKKFVVNDN